MDKNNRYLMDFRTQYHLIKQFLCRNTWKLLYFSLNNHTKYLSKLTKNPSTCNPKILTKLSELWVWNSRSGKNVSDPDPGIKKKPVLRIRDVYHRSRILIFTHPGSRISDPGSKNSNKREGLKKICCHTYLFMYPQISQNCKLF